MLVLFLSTALLPTARAEEGGIAEAPAPTAPADSDNFFFVGGGLAVRPGFSQDTFTLGGEAEADLRFGVGMVSGRFDLDVTGTVLPDVGIVEAAPDIIPINVVRPEWAMLEAAGDSWAARGGIVNAAFGLEDWDDWALYLPTHGQYFAATPGRMAGSEFGWTFGEEGPTVTIGGGLDMDYEEPIVEASVNYESDGWATWSGVAVYPAMDTYEAVLGAEVYPADFMTLALGGVAGMGQGSTFADVSVYGVFLPEAMINPTIRVEGNYDPDGWTGAAPWAVSAGGAIVPTDWMKFLIEAKVLGAEGDPVPGVYASLCVFRPELEEEE
ncbi:hypothetical protein LBMAG42_38080 [Deltaproteobacteria bacterium]|nr:hypothetical protein LBMAG42_38080 [Deltaproteobacteria bacterium]